jgi:O-antigen/teichoic acid export membrane protein
VDTDKVIEEGTARDAVFLDFVKGSSLIGLGAILGSVVEYAIRVGIGRYLGPADYGLFSLGYTLFVILGVISVFGTDIGIAQGVSRHLAASRIGAARATLRWGVGVALAVGSTCALLLTLLAPVLADELWGDRIRSTLVAFAWLLPLWGLFHSGLAGLRGTKSMTAMFLSRDVVERGTRLLAFLAVAFVGLGIVATVGAYYVSLVLATTVAFWLLRARTRHWSAAGWTPGMFRPLMDYIWPITLGDALNFVRNTGIVLVLASFVPPAEVGIFAAANVLALLFQLPLLMSSALFLPSIAEMLVHGRTADSAQLYRALARWFFVYGVGAYLFLALSPHSLIALPLGREYREMAPIFLILAAGNLVNLISANCGDFLLAAGQSRRLAVSRICSFALATVLALALVPRHGAIGAAVAASVSMTLESTVQVAFLYRSWRIQPLSWFQLRFLALASVVFGVAWLIRQSGIVGNGFGAVACMVVAALLVLALTPAVAGAHEEDRELARIAVRRLVRRRL